MKAIVTLIICCLSICSYSQEHQSTSLDTGQKHTLAPCIPGVRDKLKIDTIRAARFGAIVDQLYGKLSSNKKLTLSEDRALVQLMNTDFWSDFDKQQNRMKRFPRLTQIRDIFDRRYKQLLRGKYSVCNGLGFSPYFIQLHIQYLGNPFACDRFFVID
jgi:hypothetical protein